MKPLQSPTSLVESSQGIDLRSYDARREAGSSVLYCRSGTYTANFSDVGSRIVLNKRRLTEETVLSALQLANAKWGATEITGNYNYKKLCVSLAVKHGLKLANPNLSAEVERQKVTNNFLRNFTLKLAENPKIYMNSQYTLNTQISFNICVGEPNPLNRNGLLFIGRRLACLPFSH